MSLFNKDEEKEESEGDEESDEEVYEVERVVDYAYCKQTVGPECSAATFLLFPPNKYIHWIHVGPLKN